jgi:hypothetical protein
VLQADSTADAPVRYIVLEVHDGPAEKVLRALPEAGSGRELAVHLRDGWAGTPAQPGDTLHVLAHVDVVDGQAHAVCDHGQGTHKWNGAGLVSISCPFFLQQSMCDVLEAPGGAVGNLDKAWPAQGQTVFI